MLKALLAPYLSWIVTAAVVAAVGVSIYAYNAVYERGYEAMRAVHEKALADQAAANNVVIAAAEKGLREDVALIILEKEKLEDEVARLSREAAQDPGAAECGIGSGSVQRLNSVR
ncbi:hypothetical protein B9J07_28290 [Sinorhizobium sp. LM21]|uniref:hypothetical protein n=1 Tax=Sinorhizobium sp. LM21 TaxID=1449788 RepID=UPI0005D89BEE|nr:hypothetical protein [Sinorhizobium sp. LM21]AJW30259.1 hypothetical protein pLM21S1_p141 [Sinorhizobium sp. LM21]OWZ90488.1 hypothetical protein B9J07_28290 [Sinorhizobium sp. LM21]